MSFSSLTLQSCSLPCFKSHQEACESFQSVAGHDSTIEPSKVPNDSPDVVATSLSGLFEQYPDLRARLATVYRNTLPPENLNEGRGRNHSSKPRTWTSEDALQAGVRCLSESLDHAHPDTKGLQAFMKYIATCSEVESYGAHTGTAP